MKFVPKTVSRSLGRNKLKLQANAPHLAFGLGVAGVITGTVLACRATLKLEKTLDDIRYEIEDVSKHQVEEEKAKDLVYVYAKSTVKLARLYGPSVIITAGSIGLLTGSHVTLTRRNNALTATVVGLTKAFDEYRLRVREELGEEAEQDLYYGIVKETIVDENGKKQKIVTPLGDPSKVSPYARFFDEYSPHWEKDPEVNRMYVQVQQNWANQLLQSRGHVFLNEVYDMLGIPRSRSGAVVGWTLSGEGDNYVDFGIFANDNTSFVNGWNRSVLLDFNVDGVILNHIQ
jgi:hypothetical protein